MVSTSTLRLTANDLDVALLLVGRDHRISFANAAAHQLLGYPYGGLHRLPLERLIPPARLGELQNVDAVLAGQASRRVRSLVTRASGGIVEVGLTLEPCRDDVGQVVAVSLRYELLTRAAHGSDGDEPERSRGDPMQSGMRLDASRAHHSLNEQVKASLMLLRTVEEQLNRAHDDHDALDRARDALNDARHVLEECALDLLALDPSQQRLPSPPKLPPE